MSKSASRLPVGTYLASGLLGSVAGASTAGGGVAGASVVGAGTAAGVASVVVEVGAASGADSSGLQPETRARERAIPDTRDHILRCNFTDELLEWGAGRAVVVQWDRKTGSSMRPGPVHYRNHTGDAAAHPKRSSQKIIDGPGPTRNRKDGRMSDRMQGWIGE
jgi:hypothetical protein